MAEKISLIIAGGEMTTAMNDGVMTSQQRIETETIQSWIPAWCADSVELYDWSHQQSSHYSVNMTVDLVGLISQKVASGSRAVVVFCGSDAVEEMAYLTDLLWRYPQPVIFAITHTPPSAPGSDAMTVMNEALLAASSQETWGRGVLICTGGKLFVASDFQEVANYGRCGFDGIFMGSAGGIVNGKVFIRPLPQRLKMFDSNVMPARNVELLMASLGAGEKILQLLVSGKPGIIDGLVIGGMGGGNVYPTWVPHLKALVRSGVPVVMASRCMKGYVLDNSSFEGSFLKLKEFGVMSAGFLTPLQARLRTAVGIGAGLKGADLQKYLLAR